VAAVAYTQPAVDPVQAQLPAAGILASAAAVAAAGLSDSLTAAVLLSCSYRHLACRLTTTTMDPSR